MVILQTLSYTQKNAKMAKKKQIPNIQGPQAKKGDLVHVTTEEGVVIVGEVVGFVEGAKNWIKDVKVKSKDGFTLMEVKHLGVELVQLISNIAKSTAWKKFWTGFTNLFRKKGNKK